MCRACMRGGTGASPGLAVGAGVMELSDGESPI